MSVNAIHTDMAQITVKSDGRRPTMASVAQNLEAPRKGSRTRVFMRGTVFTPVGASVVWIRDISNDGALVGGNDPMPPRGDIVFKRGDVFVAGFIAWANGNEAGVEFYRELTDAELDSARLPLRNRAD